MAQNIAVNCEVKRKFGKKIIMLDDALKKEKGENYKNKYKTAAPPNVMSFDGKEALVRVSLEEKRADE